MNYRDYYAKTIRDHQTGFKGVYGGTGLGKTSAIESIVYEGLPDGRQPIYVANRTQLLGEMQGRFADGISVILPKDLECVISVLTTRRRDFDRLIDSPAFTAYQKFVDMRRFRQAIRALEPLLRQNPSGILPQIVEHSAETESRHIMRTIKSVILQAKESSQQHYETFLNDSVVQTLFPFIAFRRNVKSKILLVTLQKLFYGFFDGERTVNITKLKNYIIFADEFDFLESDLISLICHSQQIEDPFDFVKHFYDNMEYHKLGLPNYPVSSSPDIRRRIEEIRDNIKALQAQGIRYPQIRQFTCVGEQMNQAVFRTTHTISTSPIYLCQTHRAFAVVIDKEFPCDGIAFAARNFFSTIQLATERILTLLKELEDDDPITYKGLMRDCFHNTIFMEQVTQIAQFPQRRRNQLTRLGALLDAGYNLFDINQVNNPSDPEEVILRNYAIYTTPERLIATLAEHNLLFGLSATAVIPRCIGNFNYEWLSKQKGVNVINVDEEDESIIRSLNLEKADSRKNQIDVVRLSELNHRDSFQKRLQKFVAAVSEDEGFGADTKSGHLKQRLERFLSTLTWASQRSQDVLANDSHIVFLNTFKQVKLMLDEYGKNNNGLFAAQERTYEQLFTSYDLEFQGTSFIVVFYDAAYARRIRQHDGVQDKFDALFWEERPVIVITQYLSAGNGVNLQYRPTRTSGKDERQDFLHLHLLEAPYFYFGGLDDDVTHEDRIAAIKENIWYQAKLHAAKYISEAEFKERLATIHNPRDWNNRYQQHPTTNRDYILTIRAKSEPDRTVSRDNATSL